MKWEPGSAPHNEPYLPDDALVEAVNMAIRFGRPLLLRGEPGCGKTKLARVVAMDLGLPPPFEFHVMSTSRARDLLYTYDGVGRLRDAQLAAAKVVDKQVKKRLAKPDSYIRWGPIGKAFQGDRPAVVLIDEIDKADVDFPNDLLQSLDEQRFTVEEIGLEVEARARAFIFITSNDEKDLPDAFLRRCHFHYIEFPEPDTLRRIVQAHHPDGTSDLVEYAVNSFLALRAEMAERKGASGKKVTTSELLDWFNALSTLTTVPKEGSPLPFASVLLKTVEDYQRYARADK